MSLIKDIKQILQSNNINIPIYLAFTPPIDDDIVVTIRATGGKDPMIAAKINEPTIQIYCKSKDYEVGYNTLSNISDVLTNISDIIIDNTRYMAGYQQGDILDLGYKDGYFDMTLNFRMYTTKH